MAGGGLEGARGRAGQDAPGLENGAFEGFINQPIIS
jgi:hypothetical protein